MTSLASSPANSPLKRTFDAAEIDFNPNPTTKPRSHADRILSSSTLKKAHRRRASSSSNSLSSTTSSPVMHPPMASLMAVFDSDTVMSGTDDSPLTSPLFPRFMPAKPQGHHYSNSTSTSNSTDSSPTSSTSTVVTDPSPGVFKESPISSLSGRMASTEDVTLPDIQVSGFSSPGKRGRNAKNLSLNFGAPAKSKKAPPPPSPLHVQSFPEASPQKAVAPPSSDRLELPGPDPKVFSGNFVKPAQPQRRKPGPLGGLSIKLPQTNLKAPALRHIQSTPTLSLFSPTVQSFQAPSIPEGPPPARHMSIDSGEPVSHVIMRSKQEEDYDPPLSQEVKSPTYPEGPVCIYDPNVFLYLEPNADEAAKFDTVFNVASEVLNPFEARRKAAEERGSPAQQKSSIFALRDAYQANAEIVAQVMDLTPNTAQAELKEPEYFHLPWEHNTQISDELLTLVEEIDKRAQAGKKVLVHCQCGVSRSASLIIAYGIYKNPSLSVQQAYDAVKQRSRWIGPNMSLIYQLSDFKNKLAAKLAANKTGPRFGRGKTTGNGRSNTIANDSPTTQYAHSELPEQAQPLTAPLPREREREEKKEHVVSPIITQNLGDHTPGPLSCPPDFWGTPDIRPWEQPSLGLGDRMVTEEDMGTTPLATASLPVEETDDERTPNIFSPTRTEFGLTEFSKIPRIGNVPKGRRRTEEKHEFGLSRTSSSSSVVKNAPTANSFIIPPSPGALSPLLADTINEMQDHVGSDSLFSPLRSEFGNISFPSMDVASPSSTTMQSPTLSPSPEPSISRKRSIASILIPDDEPVLDVAAFANKNIDADHIGQDSLFSPLRTEFGNPFNSLEIETNSASPPRNISPKSTPSPAASLRTRHSVARMRMTPLTLGMQPPLTPAIDKEHSGPDSLFSPLQSTFGNIAFPTVESKTSSQNLRVKKSMPALGINTARDMPHKGVNMIPILPPRHVFGAGGPPGPIPGPMPLPTPPSAVAPTQTNDWELADAGLGSPRTESFGPLFK